jgi:tellurite resistance protein TehA-like permease
MMRFPPSAFSAVMATGIVSIAAYLQSLTSLAHLLLWIGGVVYGLLWLLMLVRAMVTPGTLTADLSSFQHGAGLFTLPAGTFVLGSAVIILTDDADLALLLWAAGVALWTMVTYGLCCVAITRGYRTRLASGLYGGSLVAIVGTQGVAVLATHLGAAGVSPRLLIHVALIFFSLGCAFYLYIMPLLVHRLLLEPVGPADLRPSYWVCMGVAAISALAGSLLAQQSSASLLLSDLRPTVVFTSLVFWAIACWWIPLLVLLGIWRHLVRGYPLTYTTSWWSMVFPIGMFAVASHQLSDLSGFAELHAIARGAVYCSIVAWCITAIGAVLGGRVSSQGGRTS